MFCPNCGEKIESSNQKFCQNCGAKLNLIKKTTPEVSSEKVAPSRKVSSKKEEPIGEDTIRSYKFGLTSFILSIITVVIGILFIFIIRFSVKVTYYFDIDLYYLLTFPDELIEDILEFYFPFYFREDYYLESYMAILGNILGVVFIITGIAGLVLGILSIVIRRKAIRTEAKNKKINTAGFFGVFGLVLSIIAIIIAIILLVMTNLLTVFLEVSSFFLLT